MNIKSLTDFLLRKQSEFDTEQCSKNENHIYLIVDKYDC